MFKKKKTIGVRIPYSIIFKESSDGYEFIQEGINSPLNGCVVRETEKIRNPDKSWSVSKSSCFIPGMMLQKVHEKDDTKSYYKLARMD